ncbi:Prolyl 3-hydroxylase 1 [Frankliniella fusca]|uniref:procollagen-proline 3-dioxygenase n=1 Tax=Frankliniella fusca TaxID=407009 RepID=A0AAE1H654_9NEOP|nr:Prolyl 3-hydroxylase 1 [Frankliniella fusca]
MKSTMKLAASSALLLLLLAVGLCAGAQDGDAAAAAAAAPATTQDADDQPQEDKPHPGDDVQSPPRVEDAEEDVRDNELLDTEEAEPTPEDADDEVAVDSSAPPVTSPPPTSEAPDEDSTPVAAESSPASPPPPEVSPPEVPPPEPAWNRSAPDWFKLGVDAYLSEHWDQCSRALENAIVEWHFFRRANIDCRMRCGEEARRAAPLYPEDVEHLHFVEEMVRATLCILKCKRRAFRGHATPDALPSAVQRTFRNLKPYEYLQLCYYQTKQTQKAASAVFTILSHDPENEIMRHNFKYYLEKPEIDANNLVNYEAEKFVSLFSQGTDAYYAEEYDVAVTNMEASIKEFLKANDECRADCEGPFDQGWLPDFTSSIANHFVYCLKCKAKCQSKLSRLNGEKYDDFLAKHFDYLQYAYYKQGNLKKACTAAGTYLMILPADTTMLENVQYYKSLPKVDDTMFQPRPDIVKFVKRQSYEDNLLTYIADEFVFEEKDDTNEIPSAEEIYKDGIRVTPIKKGTIKVLTETKVQEDNVIPDVPNNTQAQETIGQHQDVQDVSNGSQKEMASNSETYFDTNLQGLLAQLTSAIHRPLYNLKKEDELGGVNRFVIDGLAEKTECERDGYNGNKSPHSPQETFEGVTLGKAALMMNFNLIERSILQLFLNLSERGKNIIASYFRIPQKDLYFSYTHLVCRSAKPGKSFNSSQFSHEIHADNCWMLRDGDCVKAYPAYYWRDYSALLYLNDNFKGGDFFFSADMNGNHIQSSIQPKCGRLVGFSAGIENLHGVNAVEQGSRCALALWFTLSPERAEWGRFLTEQVITDIENGKEPKQDVLQNLRKLVQFDLGKAQSQMLYKSSDHEDTLISDSYQDN